MVSATGSCRFAGEQEAAEFLAGKIVAEARRQGVPFGEDERRFLFYDPKRPQTGAGLERLCAIEDDSYDSIVIPLIKSAREHDHDLVGEQAKYSAALDALEDSGWYVASLADEALFEGPAPASRRFPLARVLLIVAVAVVTVLLAVKILLIK